VACRVARYTAENRARFTKAVEVTLPARRFQDGPTGDRGFFCANPMSSPLAYGADRVRWLPWIVRSTVGVSPRRKMTHEPVPRKARDFFERALLLEQVRCARNDA